MTDVPLSTGLPETVLPPVDAALLGDLAGAAGLAGAERRARLGALAAANPSTPEVWAALAESSTDPVDAYAYARVGYHRGLDALRANGWRGSGYVRWRNPSNQGFLRCLASLGASAAAIGETAEASRCEQFGRQLDPDWDRRPDR